MDEFSVVLRARTFVRETGSLGLPPSVEAYVQQIGGVLRHEADLPNDEPGYSFERAVLHQSPDKRGVPLPVKMVSQLTQTWHSQVRSFC